MDFLQRETHSNFYLFYAAKSLEFAADKITDLFKLLRNNKNLAGRRESRFFFFFKMNILPLLLVWIFIEGSEILNFNVLPRRMWRMRKDNDG